MGYLKTLCLVAVMAGALLVLVGMGTASATVLCSTTSTPCSNVYGVNTKYHGETTAGAVLETSLGEQISKCEKSTIKGTVQEAGGAKKVAVVNVAELTWVNCSSKTETVAGGKLGFDSIAGTDNGTATDLGTELLVVYLGAECEYGIGAITPVVVGTLTGKLSNPVLDINGTLPKIAGGFICPSSIKWTAEYQLKEPQPLFVESE